MSLTPASLDNSSITTPLMGSQSPVMFSSNLVGGRSRRIRKRARKTYNSFTSMKKTAKKGLLNKITHLFSKSKKNKRTNKKRFSNKKRMRGGGLDDPNQVMRASASPASIGTGTSCGPFPKH
jgi:hypothetical protein